MQDTLVIGKSLRFLAKKYNLILINDNCHALGAKINNNKNTLLNMQILQHTVIIL